MTIDDRLKRAHAYCQANGKQLTDQRVKVLRILFEQNKALKAYDILAFLQKSEPNTAPVIVYRALDFLIEQGMVHKLDTINAFSACDHFSEPHHAVILVCDQCQTTVEVSHSILDQIKGVASTLGFQPHHQDITVKGVCKDCTDET